MKRDYYSDIKLAERIIFQNTAYLLTMLDKKLDSFTSQKTANMRARERNDLLHPDNVLHPEAPRAILNPLATLANDLTKPVWNCITRVEPVAVSVLPEFGLQTQTQRLISAFNQSMICFFERFKYQHQDEVSLKLHINLVDRVSKIKLLFEDIEQKKVNQTQLLLQKLFGMLQAAYRKKFQTSTSQEFLANLQIFEKITLKDPQTGRYLNPGIVAQITIFAQQIEQYIKNVAESLSGPVYINYSLQQQKLSLVLHPMMLAIYCSIKNQIIHQEEGKQQTNSKNSFFQSRIESEQPIFQQLKSYNCSKITFINMDGYESSANLHLAKHLRKYLQYISFPLQEQSFTSNNIEFNDLTSYFRWRSQMLAKQYMACFYEPQKHGNLYGGKETNQRQTFEQLYKRLLVIPVNSIYISNKTDAPSISGFESQFVLFMMKQIIYNQIRQFGPSVIIVSHSNTLPILSSHLEQIFAQLSILTNMKIIFYNNITHSIVPYVTEQKKDYFLMNHIKYYTLKQQWSSPLSFTNQIQRFPISIDMLQRASIFFKICSGTANLTFEARQNDQKFQNSKIMRYAGLVMRKICQKHPVLSKFDHRFLQYLKIDKLYSNHLQNNQQISIYHRKIYELAQRELSRRYGQQFLSSTQMKAFFQEYSSRLIKQRQSQQTKYITKLPDYNQNQSYGLIALEFQIWQDQTYRLVSLNQNSQVLISTTRKYTSCPVFVLNHLNREKNQLQNYFGFVDETVERSCEGRVKLQKMVFQQNIYDIHLTHQHLTQFNFYQTETSVILFWPVLYDAKQALLHNFQRITYHPKITSLFFVGSKADLRYLSHVQPVNESYKSIHPRIGCTCYQPPFSNSIYVFGGFYTDIENYLDFQTDISVIKLEKELGISIQNVAKSFFMNYQEQPSFRMVTSVNNDFVRPRVQYEVYELQSENNDIKQILLLGGVGEKFTRPFSLIGYMAHLIRFQGPFLAKIDRIKINNIVPANLNRPLKSRATTEMPVIKVAQNRRIFATKSSIHPGMLTFSSFKLKYISQDPNQNKTCLGKQMAMRNRRMTYTKNYELAMQQKWFELQYPKQTTYTVTLREGNQNKSYRCILRHYSYKSNNQANVLLTVQANRIYLFNLVFYLQDDAAQRFINLQGKTVRLAPHNIVAADTYFKDVYVLIFHQQFTEGLFILARSNVRNTSQLIQNDIRQLLVNQIYCFDSIPQKCVIKVIEGQQIALLHGLNFTENIHQEYLVKRIGSYYTRLPIQASDPVGQIRQAIDISKRILQSNKKSFILGSGHKLFCISFITVERVQGTRQGIYVVVEQLNLNQAVLKWRIKSQNKFIFELNIEQIIEFQNKKQNKPLNEQIIFQTKNYMLNKEILDVYQTTEGKDIFIVLTDQRYVYEGSINIENLGRFNNLLFLPIQCQGQFILYQNYETERMRDRSNGFHIFAKTIDKEAMGIRTQTQLISEEMGTINIL